MGADAATIERFVAQCHRRKYPSRSDIFNPGDPANTLYYIISGSVSIIARESDDRELVLGYIGAGEFIGEMGLFVETHQRGVALRTRTACELAEISYERLQALLQTQANDATRLGPYADGWLQYGRYDNRVSSELGTARYGSSVWTAGRKKKWANTMPPIHTTMDSRWISLREA